MLSEVIEFLWKGKDYKDADVKTLCLIGVDPYKACAKTIKNFSSKARPISLNDFTFGTHFIKVDPSVLTSTKLSFPLNSTFTDNTNKIILVGGDSISFFAFFIKKASKWYDIYIIPPKTKVVRLKEDGKFLGFNGFHTKIKYALTHKCFITKSN